MYGITKQWSDQLRTYSNGSVDENGFLAYSHEGLFPEYNTERLPLANPPPPAEHEQFVKRHELAKVSRFFSKFLHFLTKINNDAGCLLIYMKVYFINPSD